ncbi:MAG TPA: hypothetical protein VNO21_24130 [Polyangiaceae bacterium]|nr:hypothetical protein [Polyangiaceae bacterium]
MATNDSSHARRVSVAEAKARLPELLRDADRAPRATIEVTRHGVVVGAIIGPKALSRLKKPKKPNPYEAWRKWRSTVEPGILGDTADLFEGIDRPTPPPIEYE